MLIDVVLPYYGDPGLMRVAVNSVRDQTTADWRLLIVDDCYPSRDVEQWVASLCDSRIQYVTNTRNLGANRNYAKAVSLSSAEYVVIFGADDRLLPNFLERTTSLIEAHDRPQVIQPGVDVIDAAGQRSRPLVDRTKQLLRPNVGDVGVLGGESLAISLLRGNWTYFPSLVWRRETIANLGFRPFSVVQDLALLIDVVRHDGRMVLDRTVSFEYRRHADSDSAVKTMTGDRFAEERRYFRLIERDLHSDGWPRAARAARMHLTSRLHAASLLPRAVRSHDRRVVGSLIHHATR